MVIIYLLSINYYFFFYCKCVYLKKKDSPTERIQYPSEPQVEKHCPQINFHHVFNATYYILHVRTVPNRSLPWFEASIQPSVVYDIMLQSLITLPLPQTVFGETRQSHCCLTVRVRGGIGPTWTLETMYNIWLEPVASADDVVPPFRIPGSDGRVTRWSSSLLP